MEPFGVMSHRGDRVKVYTYGKYFIVTLKFKFLYNYDQDINTLYDIETFTREWCQKWTPEEVVRDTFCKHYTVSDPRWVSDDVLQFRIQREPDVTDIDIIRTIEFTYLIDRIYENGLVDFWVVPRCLDRVM
jgi:hypothetical protein